MENLAELARLELTDKEKEKILIDLDSILKYVQQIKKVKVGKVQPTFQLFNVWREDEEKTREFTKDGILEQFPEKHGDFLKVKKIL